MSVQVEVYDVSCPASTPVASPIEVTAVTDTSILYKRVEIVIPFGHAYLTGIALAYGHVPVIPRNASAFFTGDDDKFAYDLTGYPAGVPWTLFLCNLDLQAHKWHTRWELDTNTMPTGQPITSMLTPSAIYTAGAITPTGL